MTTPPGDHQHDPLGFLVSTAANLVRHRATAALSHENVTPLEAGIVLGLTAGSASQTALSSHHRIDRTTMVTIIDRLETLGLVTRSADPADRRRHAVTITTRGRSAAKRIRTILDAIEGDVTAGSTSAEIDTTRRVLARMIAADDHTDPVATRTHRRPERVRPAAGPGVSPVRNRAD